MFDVTTEFLRMIEVSKLNICYSIMPQASTLNVVARIPYIVSYNGCIDFFDNIHIDYVDLRITRDTCLILK